MLNTLRRQKLTVQQAQKRNASNLWLMNTCCHSNQRQHLFNTQCTYFCSNANAHSTVVGTGKVLDAHSTENLFGTWMFQLKAPVGSVNGLLNLGRLDVRLGVDCLCAG